MRSAASARLAEEALKLIEAGKAKPASSSDIAKSLGCSRQFADRCLTRVCGKTLRALMEDARMGEAKRRLDDGASVREIVAGMQFSSANQFYRIYKRYFGKTIRQSAK